MHINSFNSHTYSTREVVLLLSSLRELRQKRAGHVPKVTERAGGGASTATHPRVNVPHHSNPLNCPKCSAERHYSPQSYCHFHSSITTTVPAGCPGHLVDGCIPSLCLLLPSLEEQLSLRPMASEDKASSALAEATRPKLHCPCSWAHLLPLAHWSISPSSLGSHQPR